MYMVYVHRVYNYLGSHSVLLAHENLRLLRLLGYNEKEPLFIALYIIMLT